MTYLRPGVFAAVATGTLLALLSACSNIDESEDRGTDQTTAVANTGAAATPTVTTNTAVRPADIVGTTDLVELATPSVVRVSNRSGVGSGFIIDAGGYIITNHHVIEEASSAIEVTLNDGSVLTADVVGIDPKSDLAVLKVNAGHELPALPLASLADVRVGDDVVAIGFALDLASGRGDPSVTRGIVSAKNRPINDSGILGAVQTDAAINHGNSGGPLINYRGEVVGVNTALAPDTGSQGLAQNIGFAVGANTVAAVYEEILDTGRVDRGFLGIANFSALRPAEAEARGIPANQPGILIPPTGVTTGSPADIAGIDGGDVIVEIDGHAIGDESDLWVSMITHDPGDAVPVKVFRSGQLLELDVTLGSAD